MPYRRRLCPARPLAAPALAAPQLTTRVSGAPPPRSHGYYWWYMIAAPRGSRCSILDLVVSGPARNLHQPILPALQELAAWLAVHAKPGQRKGKKGCCRAARGACVCACTCTRSRSHVAQRVQNTCRQRLPPAPCKPFPTTTTIPHPLGPAQRLQQLPHGHEVGVAPRSQQRRLVAHVGQLGA